MNPDASPKKFNNAWLGYDVPFQTIESQPTVQALRKAGVEKRIKAPEFHITATYFPNIDIDELTTALKQAEQECQGPLDRTSFLFDGYGIIEQPEGSYVYFTPSEKMSPEAFFLKTFFQKTTFYVQEKNCPDLHLSIGGPDPFSSRKIKTEDLGEPFTIEGKLLFVGNDGKQFRKFAWDTKEKTFHELTSESPAQSASPRAKTPSREIPLAPPKPIHTIAIFPKIQADTAAAVFLLKNFGEKQYPGAANAKVIFWNAPPEDKTPEALEQEGYLLIDLGGEIDHHIINRRTGKKDECASTILAKQLGIEHHPALQKILAWAKRDDLEGKGTISVDPIDRAFGLSAIIMNANREFQNAPEKALDFILQIISLHISEELRRHVELPNLWNELLAKNEAGLFTIERNSQKTNGAWLKTTNVALAGFLRAAKKIDLVIQRFPTNHTNLITQQGKSFDLRQVIAELRLLEAQKKGIVLTKEHQNIQAPGRMHEVEEWYYDTAANTLQNGGINPQGTPATRLSLEEILEVIKDKILLIPGA